MLFRMKNTQKPKLQFQSQTIDISYSPTEPLNITKTINWKGIEESLDMF